MRVGYLDCASGASGDMFLGALLEAGWTEAGLREVVASLRVPVRVSIGRAERRGTPAARVEIAEVGPPASRSYPELARLIDESALPDPVRRQAGAVLRRLAETEAAVHAVPLDRVHLHELGGLDTLVDIGGTVAGVRALGLARLAASPVNLGRGWIRTSHGTVPVPAPATAALMAGLPVYADEADGELLTPTGAVLLAALVSVWGPLPLMRLERIGAGAGAADPPRANVLRLFVGESLGAAAGEPGAMETTGPEPDGSPERLTMLETSIDDMSPQLVPHVTVRLFEAGALDVTTVPALMKKGRPGHLVRVLCRPEQARALTAVLFAETTTLGVRAHEVSRVALPRRAAEVETPYGPVPVKVSRDGAGVLTVTPEFDACRALAERHGVAARLVLAAAHRAAAALGDPVTADGPPRAAR